jgi:hypothetical protein
LVVPVYRVDDMQSAVAPVDTLGPASSVEEGPCGLAADTCVDGQGTVFHLHQLR